MKRIYSYVYLMIMVGIIAIFVSVFSMLLNFVVNFNQKSNPALIFLSIPVIIITHYLYRNKNKIIDLEVSKIYHQKFANPIIPLIHTVLISITTLLSHLAGVSVGREGVAVQIGATISSYVNKLNVISLYVNKHTVLCIGMATGFAAFFGTPLTGAFFAIELTNMRKHSHQLFDYLLIIICAYLGLMISNLLHLNHLHIQIDHLALSTKLILPLIFLTFLTLSFAYIYLGLFVRIKNFVRKLNISKYIIGVSGALILSSIIYLFKLDEMRGLGVNLIQASINDPKTIYVLAPAIKMLLTISFISLGFKGGEVTPIFAIGAMLGAIVATLFGVDSATFVVLGITLFFMQTTKTKIAPFFLALELCSISIWLLFIPVYLLVFKLLPKKSIYH